MSWVPFEWALRDVVQGWRGAVVVLIALIPLLFLLLVHFTVDPIEGEDQANIAAGILTIFTIPMIVGVVAILAGGTVMRAPMEDGTLIYQLIRPMNRAWIGVQRLLAVVLVVTFATVLSGISLSILLGMQRVIWSSVGGLVLAGIAFGSLYGLLISLHRYALGLPVVHLLYEWMFLSIQIEGMARATISWHALGAMGAAAEIMVDERVRVDTGGIFIVPILVAAACFALVALLFRARQFHLGLPEA